MTSKKGLAQIVIMVSLLVLAIVLPVLSKVVKQNQDLRNRASGEGCGAEGEECCYGLYCNDSLLCFPYYDDKDSSGSATVVKKICAKPGADVTATPTPIGDLECHPMIGCLPDCSCGLSTAPGADNNLCLECGLLPEPSRDPKCHPMIGCLPDCSCGRSSLPGADNNLCLRCEDMPEPTPPRTTITPTPTDIPSECKACKKIADYNCDGTVNGLDYSWWKQEFVDKLKHDGKWEASHTCSEVVGPEDFSAWRDSYLE